MICDASFSQDDLDRMISFVNKLHYAMALVTVAIWAGGVCLVFVCNRRNQKPCFIKLIWVLITLMLVIKLTDLVLIIVTNKEYYRGNE